MAPYAQYEPDDADIARALAGDQGAFERLCWKLREELITIGYLYLGEDKARLRAMTGKDQDPRTFLDFCLRHRHICEHYLAVRNSDPLSLLANLQDGDGVSFHLLCRQSRWAVLDYLQHSTPIGIKAVTGNDEAIWEWCATHRPQLQKYLPLIYRKPAPETAQGFCAKYPKQAREYLYAWHCQIDSAVHEPSHPKAAGIVEPYVHALTVDNNTLQKCLCPMSETPELKARVAFQEMCKRFEPFVLEYLRHLLKQDPVQNELHADLIGKAEKHNRRALYRVCECYRQLITHRFEVLTLALAGETKYREEFWQQFNLAMTGYLRSRVNSEDEADELLGNLALAFAERFHTYNPERASLYTFLKMLADTQLVRHYRSRRDQYQNHIMLMDLLGQDDDGHNNAIEDRLGAEEPGYKRIEDSLDYLTVAKIAFSLKRPLHQLVAYYYNRLLDKEWKPQRIAKELSDESLRDIVMQFIALYYEYSQLPTHVLADVMKPLYERAQGKEGEVIFAKPLGNHPVEKITNWTFQVRIHLNVEVRRQQSRMK